MTAAEFFRRAKVFVLPAGCATEVQQIRSQEDLLAVDGFKAVPANTPARQQQVAQLPPDHLLQRTKGDKFMYFYADPAVCNCLNIGDQAAYGRYRSEVLAQPAGRERKQVLAAETYENAPWVWGVWGPEWQGDIDEIRTGVQVRCRGRGRRNSAFPRRPVPGEGGSSPPCDLRYNDVDGVRVRDVRRELGLWPREKLLRQPSPETISRWDFAAW
jgi:hypothetical protein